MPFMPDIFSMTSFLLDALMQAFGNVVPAGAVVGVVLESDRLSDPDAQAGRLDEMASGWIGAGTAFEPARHHGDLTFGH